MRLVDSCITQLKAQGPSRTCNASKEGCTEPSLATVCAGRIRRSSLNGSEYHPGGNPCANLKSIFHRCPILVAFVWELTKETIDLPLGCLQGGRFSQRASFSRADREECSGLAVSLDERVVSVSLAGRVLCGWEARRRCGRMQRGAHALYQPANLTASCRATRAGFGAECGLTSWVMLRSTYTAVTRGGECLAWTGIRWCGVVLTCEALQRGAARRDLHSRQHLLRACVVILLLLLLLRPLRRRPLQPLLHSRTRSILRRMHGAAAPRAVGGA